MKRQGHLMEQIVERNNLEEAFCLAARSKRDRQEVWAFMRDFQSEMERLREGLLAVDYPVGAFRRFMIRDPKLREINAAPFRERVLHQAIMLVCGPILERSLVFDTYACRKGKGQWAAIRRAERFSDKSEYFLKFDIRKYFDSIHHETLKAQLGRQFKDPVLLAWFDRILRTYQTKPGRGLPIGSLISQHLANVYLSPLDHWLQGSGQVQSIVRYMDDVVVWGNDSGDLKRLESEVRSFLIEWLQLTFKESPYINRTRHGMDFLGCRVFPGYSVLNRRSRYRFRKKVRHLHMRSAVGTLSESELQQRLQALSAFTQQTKSWHFRKRILCDLGNEPERREPGEPWRQLEQQRQELPVGEPQQEEARQHEQQPGLPRRPQAQCQKENNEGTEPARFLFLHTKRDKT
jgi:RNA-directed DNA polymerase